MHWRWAALLLAGEALAGAPQVPTPAQEDAVIAANRKGAKPRPVAPSQGLSREEQERARVFNQSKKSVVFVNARTDRAVIRDMRTGSVYQVPSGTGTGFVWDELGHVVTNNHVLTVEDPNTGMPAFSAERLEVTLSNGQTYKARLIGRSLTYDTAVLHVFAPLDDLKPLAIGRSADLQVGQSVLAIGNPFGLDHTMTAGIVSALDREMSTQFGTVVKGAIQTDAAINPGNSGGPLLDRTGRLIGMNTSIANATGASVGIGFAIPVDTLNRVVPLLIAQGNLDVPTLGFTSASMGAARRYFGIERGVVVEVVDPGSLAERAGFKGVVMEGERGLLGDVIVAFQGKPVESDVQLADAMALVPRGSVFTFDVLRAGRRLTIRLDPWTNTVPKPDPDRTL